MSADFPPPQPAPDQYPVRYAEQPTQATARPRGTFDAGRLWSGGAAAAVVVALVAFLGALVMVGIFDFDLITPAGEPVSVGWLVSVSMIATLAMTALMHLLLRFSPQPLSFFSWIGTLLALVVVLLPFVYDVSTSTKIASSLVFLVIAIAIGSLVGGVANSAIRSRRVWG